LNLSEFGTLIDIMARLRGENGCPWDRTQTHESLKQYLLEETYEVLEALDENDIDSLKSELGDLLLQIVFHAQLAEERQDFTIWDVIQKINEKLIRRHPHVFGNVKADTPEMVLVNWEKIKLQEGKKSVIDGVPRELSGLLRAYRIQKKAAQVGFDWENIQQVWDKVKEEERELQEALADNDSQKILEEFGDLLFSWINLARFIKVNPEDALRYTTNKFIKRFKLIEQELAKHGKTPEDSTLEEMDLLWNEIKKNENQVLTVN
jgi:MazG family protein